MRSWKQAAVKIMVDRATLHYLANVSKFSNIEVISSIKDGSESIVKRILEKDLSFSKKRAVFPNTQIAVTYSATKFYDDRQFTRDNDKWFKRHEEETGYNYYNIPSNLSLKHKKEVHDWRQNNRKPDPEDLEYNYIRCKVTIPNSTTIFDVNEVENMLIEHVFFGAPDEHADESISESTDG